MSRNSKTATGRPSLYPWEEWFRRHRILLRRGTHYQCSNLSMGQQVRNAAVRIGALVRVTEVDGGLLVEVQPHANGRKRKASERSAS